MEVQWYRVGESETFALDEAGKAVGDPILFRAELKRLSSGHWRWGICSPLVDRPPIWGIEPTRDDAMTKGKAEYLAAVKRGEVLTPPFLNFDGNPTTTDE